MAGGLHSLNEGRRPPRATTDPLAVRIALVGVALAYFTIFLVLPVAIVFCEAMRHGLGAYLAGLSEPATLHAISLTLLVAVIVVPLNTTFGLAAAWCVTRHEFMGRRLLVLLIDLPLWISPVVGGLVYVLLYGSQGWFGPWLAAHGITVIFALPGIVMATLFVTFSFVARTVMAQMQAQGRDEEEAALTLGAGGWRTFFLITIPKIKWSLLYGIILCNARSMGEFGAVSVVSGHITNATNTMPLQVEILYNEYQFTAAFAVASLLVLLALVTLGLKTLAEWKARHERRQSLLMPIQHSPSLP